MGITSVSALEDIIVHSIYLVIYLYTLYIIVLNTNDSFIILSSCRKGLVNGKLDQKNGVFRVTAFSPRDVRKEDIRGMITKLTAWYTHWFRTVLLCNNVFI